MAGRKAKFDRRRAVKQAMEVFWQHGWTGTSVNGLAAHLGITRSSFYNTFGSMEQLFDEALTLYGSYSPGHVITRDRAAAGPDAPPATADIRRFFRMLCHHRGNDGVHQSCLMVNTMGEMDNLSPGLRARVLDHSTYLPGFFGGLVDQAIADGDLPAEVNRETLVRSLHMLAIGINAMSRITDGEESLWQMAAMTLDGLGVQA